MRRFVLRFVARAASHLPGPIARRLRATAGAARLREIQRERPLARPPRAGSLRPVICLPTWSRWEVMKQRPHYLMEAFATAGHPVYFVDSGITEPRWEDGVRLVPRVTDVPAKGVILYIHFAPLVQLVQDFDHPVVIYDIYDDLSIFQADEDNVPISRRVATHHGVLMDSAAAVLVSGATLAARHREERPDLLIVENGVDLQMFSSRSDRPEDFPAAGGPVIGYHGMVSYWFDFELLVAVARRKPEWTFVLVGPVDPRVAVEVKALGTCANILRLGEKPSSQIAAYVQHFDIGAIWFKVNGLTRAVNPLKMYECMAAGVPVVAPPLPACVAVPGVRVADDADAFAACIEAALAVAPGEADALRATARGYSWQERITPLINWLDQHDLRRVPG